MSIRTNLLGKSNSVGGIVMPYAFRVRSNFLCFLNDFGIEFEKKMVSNCFFLIFVDFTDQNIKPSKIMLFLTKVYCFSGTKRPI